MDVNLRNLSLESPMRIYFHGNCQAIASAKMWREAFPDDEVNANEVHTLEAASMADYERTVRRANVIFTQVISDDYRDEPRLSSRWLVNEFGSTAQVVKFPVLFFQGQTPQSFYLREVENYKSGYHDVHVADAAVRGIDQGQAIHTILSKAFLSERHVLRVFTASIEETCRREEVGEIDIRIGDLYSSLGRNHLIFNTFNHPSRIMLARLLERMAYAIGRCALFAEVGQDHLANVMIPPYPSVVAALGIDPVEAQQIYRVNDAPEAAESFLGGLYQHYINVVGLERLRAVLSRNTEVCRYLEAYHDE